MDAEDHRQRVRTALAEVPRADFLPRASTGRAAYDGPLQIGRGQTCSQPRTVAAMLELLEVEPAQRVLDVGAGSGWTTALLAHLTGPGGEVCGVELEPDLVSFASANLAATTYGWASVRQAAPGVLGLPQLAPYDRVLVSAMARELPTALVEQLDVGGRIVVPVNGTMLLGVRSRDGGLVVSEHGSYRFVPLRTAPEDRLDDE